MKWDPGSSEYQMGHSKIHDWCTYEVQSKIVTFILMCTWHLHAMYLFFSTFRLQLWQWSLMEGWWSEQTPGQLLGMFNYSLENFQSKLNYKCKKLFFHNWWIDLKIILPNYIIFWGLLHKTFRGEKLRLFQPEFSAYGKGNGKFMLTRVFRF